MSTILTLVGLWLGLSLALGAWLVVRYIEENKED